MNKEEIRKQFEEDHKDEFWVGLPERQDYKDAKINWLENKLIEANKTQIELTKEHLDLIWFGKKYTCEEECICHAECDMADEYIDKLSKRLKSKSEWISVDTELPKNDEEILIWSADVQKQWKEREVKPMTCYYHNGFKAYRSDDNKFLNKINITHWQPLPKPPKK